MCAQRPGQARVVAVDGSKIAAAATHHATRSYEQIAREILEGAARIDAEEDALFGDERGDELPEGLRTSGDRRKVLREAKQALDAERAAQANSDCAQSRRATGRVPAPARQDWELERYVVREHAAWHAAGIASDGSRRMVGARHNIKPYRLPPAPQGKINVTDPDSRNLKTTRGWVQGYNAQAVVGEGQIVLAAEISTASLDTANLQPMVETALDELDAAGVMRDGRAWCWPTRATGKTRRSRRSAARDPDAGRARRRSPQAATAGPARRAL